jgi:hypothetical protein
MIHLVVALPAEARGLARVLGPQRGGTGIGPQPVQYGDGIDLVVCGTGRQRARRAVEAIAGRMSQTAHHAWLNVGIAGHEDLSPGTALLAEEIRESATGRSWKPSIPFRISFPTATVCTVDWPETEYATDAAYDMEASGFFAAANRVSSPGLVQVLKVVSDNRGDELSSLTGDRVESLIRAACPTVSELLRLMTERLGHGDSD